MAKARSIFVGSDHAGFGLKLAVVSHLQSRGVSVVDFGVALGERGDYPVYAQKVALAVRARDGAFGILFCGSGVGMSIAANKVRSIRSVVCSDPYSAQMARRHNNANILALGQRVVGEDLAFLIVDAFLDAEFECGRHERRVAMISGIESGATISGDGS